ncbi:MAG TPA: hypothetical protein RMH99_23120 [Sandaracinaceae bacterium LLY-WYZ-13_1]|nr:hypothetical protein [Sandaracinaceae bacterium LLY-WYZ-13_1]
MSRNRLGAGLCALVMGASSLTGCAADTVGEAAGDVSSDEYAPTSEELRFARRWVDLCFVPRRWPDFELDIRVPERTADRLTDRTLSYPGPCYTYGESDERGDGYLETYAQYDRDGTPLAIGVSFPASTLDDLPTAATDGNHCYDLDGDGVIENDPEAMECMGGHESIVYLPDVAIDDPDMPFEWMLINWNTFGHAPPGVYTIPHFDFHFYILDQATRDSIRPGECGLLIDCDDFVTATAPIPPQYVPMDYQSVGAAEVAMGDHLVDLTSKEFTDPGSFDHTWIYGAWDGSIAFYEPMITRDYFLSEPDTCVPLKLPEAWETAGWYPLEYCMRYRPNRDDYTVSMESFVYREAE